MIKYLKIHILLASPYFCYNSKLWSFCKINCCLSFNRKKKKSFISKKKRSSIRVIWIALCVREMFLRKSQHLYYYWGVDFLTQYHFIVFVFVFIMELSKETYDRLINTVVCTNDKLMQILWTDIQVKFKITPTNLPQFYVHCLFGFSLSN